MTLDLVDCPFNDLRNLATLYSICLLVIKHLHRQSLNFRAALKCDENKKRLMESINI